MKRNDIPIKIKVSFQIYSIPTPLSKIALRIIINHFAGMILLITCIGKGILFIGKMKPDNMITGSINPISEIIIAVCCDCAKVEINIPKDKAVTINKTVSTANKNRLPLIGILKMKYPNVKITIALITERNIYGKTFPNIT